MIHLHDVVEYDGQRWVVVLINDCRARLHPLSGTPVQITTASGSTTTFTRQNRPVSVSPGSELPVVGRMKDLPRQQKRRAARKQQPRRNKQTTRQGKT